jgi:purine-binding chemotaxis protein CheW
MNGPDFLNNDSSPQYLTFYLQDEVYALGIESIREIREVGTAAPLPGSPPYVRGIINLRGAIVPVIDLRVRLGLPPSPIENRFAVTIITRLGNKSIGLNADAVHEVIRIPEALKRKTFSLLEHGDKRFVDSLALLTSTTLSKDSEETLVVILNLDRLYDPTIAPTFEAPQTPITTEAHV